MSGKQNQNQTLNEHILAEIWDEINVLEGRALDEYLSEIGLAPDELLQHYAASFKSAVLASKRSRFEEAKRHVHNRSFPKASTVISLDVARKRQILTAIKEWTAQSNEMTIAARNQKIEAEEDLDSFLEACIKLGVIDDDGNLKI